MWSSGHKMKVRKYISRSIVSWACFIVFLPFQNVPGQIVRTKSFFRKPKHWSKNVAQVNHALANKYSVQTYGLSSVHWNILRRFVHTKHNFTLRHATLFQGLLKIKARGKGLGRAGRGKMADAPRSPKSPKTPQISPLSPRQNNAESC